MRHALLALLLIAPVAPAMADELIAFQSPSGNIFCMMDSGEYAGARCDMLELTPSFSQPPADCDLDFGSSFWIGSTGPGAPACVGDTVITPDARVLDYGETVSLGGVTCSSAKTGMTCKNSEGHGFSLSKAKQKIF